MTLTLEQVRQTRFHLARRNGYEPVDVDNFVDKVEATLSQLTEENGSLKKQLEALSSSEPSSIFVPGDNAEADKLRAQLAERQQELEALRGQLAEAQAAAEKAQADLAEAQGALADTKASVNKSDVDAQAAVAAAEAAAKAEIESLRAELAQAKQESAEVATAASAAAAVVPLDGPSGKVENIIVTTSAEASPAVTRLLQMATEQAERLVGESQTEAEQIVSSARAEAETVIDSANRKAHEALTDARTRADRIESEARVNAEKLTSDAQTKAEQVTSEADALRTELFSALEAERDSLRGKVDRLRAFEQNYRSTMANHLQSQLRTLTDAALEPSDLPEILTEPGPGSATPRLDALLNEGN